MCVHAPNCEPGAREILRDRARSFLRLPPTPRTLPCRGCGATTAETVSLAGGAQDGALYTFTATHDYVAASVTSGDCNVTATLKDGDQVSSVSSAVVKLYTNAIAISFATTQNANSAKMAVEVAVPTSGPPASQTVEVDW